MMLAPLVLAAALGQVCPAPPGRNGPPPCAAANVPGCLPGYRAQVDRWGRTTYVCDPAYWQQQQQWQQPQYQQPQYQQPPQAQATPQGAPPAYAPPPPAQVPPPPAYGPPATPPPPPVGYAPQPAPQHRGLVALVLMPGGTTLHDDHYLQTTQDPRGALGLELEMRPFHGGSRFRLGYEYMGSSTQVDSMSVIDFSFKYDFIQGAVSPFFSVGLGGAAVDSRLTGDYSTTFDRHVWRGALSVSAGLDFYLSQNVFITAELKQRWIAKEPQDPVQLSTTSFFGGLGFYF